MDSVEPQCLFLNYTQPFANCSAKALYEFESLTRIKESLQNEIPYSESGVEDVKKTF